MRVVLVIAVNLGLLAWAAQSSAQDLAEVEAARRANDAVAQLYEEGRYTEAIGPAEQALAQAERTLGPENPEALISLNNLAVMYRALGRLDEAEPLYLRALATQERILGPGHPDTLLSLNNLAVLY
ncbi:tetratricopeptide repeat protein, partial [Fusobacterium necrophorum]|uniref:tetratricopeptide repeat protein n=1 Tax=Fusobacterium necrophorum TaxID=859 RepID=UPI00255051D3